MSTDGIDTRTDKVLKLFHGSKSGIVGDISPRSRACCDFGRGFYMGDNIAQPQTLICRMENPVLYTLSLDMSGLSVGTFASVREWALFVAYNRGAMADYSDSPLYERMASMSFGKDVLLGRIANDRVFYAAQRFFDGVITLETLVEVLKAINYGNQYVAISANACSRIKIIESRILSHAECENLRLKSEMQRTRAERMTDDVIRSRRHQDGMFFDELCDRIANGEMVS